MKKFIVALICTVLVVAAQAKETVKIIVPSAAGGLQHRIALFLQKAMQEENSNIEVVVIPRPGGDGAVGLQEVVNDRGDATFIMTGQGILYKSLQVQSMMDNIAQLKPTIMMFETYFVLVTEKGSQIQTFQDLRARAHGGWVNIGASLAISNFVAGEMLRDLPNLTYVTYNSDPQVLLNLKSGVVDVGVITYPTAAGRPDLNVLASSDPQGLRKAGIRTNKTLMTQHGLWAGPATPQDTVIRINRLIRTVLENPQRQQEIQSWHLTIYREDRTPEGLRAAADKFIANVKK